MHAEIQQLLNFEVNMPINYHNTSTLIIIICVFLNRKSRLLAIGLYNKITSVNKD